MTVAEDASSRLVSSCERVESPRGQTPWLAQAGAALALLALVVANLVWLHHYRFGLPFNIDEAGYLQRSLQYQQAIDAGSVHQVISHWQTPDIVAPVLPFTAGVIDAVLHLSAWGLVGIEQVFYVLAIVGTYLLGRRFLSVGWALVASGVVASLPGLLDSSRLYLLSTPATAFFVLSLWAQSRAGNFLGLRRALAWGALIGVFALTRTMVLGLLPAFVIIATVRAALSGQPRLALRNVGLALALGAIISMSWYWTSWHAVYHYLTQFGYGSQANLYTGSQTLSLAARLGDRIADMASQDLFLPLLLALILPLVLAAGIWTARYSRTRRLPGSAATSGGPRRHWALRRAFDTPLFDIAAIALIAAAVLCSTSNIGSFFELPLAPTVVIFAIVTLSRLVSGMRLVGLAVLAIAVGLTLVDQFGLAPSLASVASVGIGKVSIIAFNSDEADFVGPKLQRLTLGGVYWNNCGGATVTCFYGRTTQISASYLDHWAGVNQEISRFIYSYGQAHGYEPVVFFAYQGPLLNTNTVGLAAQLSGRSLPIGALMPPALRKGQGYVSQLESPELGQPNFVIAEGHPTRSLGAGGSSPALARGVDNALRTDGFHVIKEFTLADAPSLAIWWKDR